MRHLFYLYDFNTKLNKGTFLRAVEPEVLCWLHENTFTNFFFYILKELLVGCLGSNLDGFFFSRQHTELVDDPGRHRGQLIKCLLETDGGRYLQLYTETEIQKHSQNDKIDSLEISLTKVLKKDLTWSN